MKIIALLCFPLFILTTCKTPKISNIEKVYTIDGQQRTVFYDTDTKKSQVLIQDSESVFFVMTTSKNNEWVELSKMPADPDEAYGVNEEKLLMYIPQKKIICHPTYGSNVSLLGIDITNNIESIIWYMHDETMDTIPIVKLEKTCLGHNEGCDCN